MGPGLLQWTDFFSRARNSAPVFSVHPKLPQQLVDRLETALESLRSERISIVHMFDHAYFARAFLDGGWVMRSPPGLNGPGREWIVGRWALGLLCHRLEAKLPRRGRFRTLPDDLSLEEAWAKQQAEQASLGRQARHLAEAGYRPELETLAAQLHRSWPLFGVGPDAALDQV